MDRALIGDLRTNEEEVDILGRGGVFSFLAALIPSAMVLRTVNHSLLFWRKITGAILRS
jgi:hypothetical protein